MKQRLIALLVGVLCSIVLYLAIILEPSNSGVGTHQQLGMAPCGFLVMSGYPCPMCGMTTTFALAADGRILKALINQPFGVFLFACNLFLLVSAMMDFVRPGKRIIHLWMYFNKHGRRLSWYLLLALLLSWILKIMTL